MTDLTGRTLGQYEIIEQIGQGGMATVFKASEFFIYSALSSQKLPFPPPKTAQTKRR